MRRRKRRTGRIWYVVFAILIISCIGYVVMNMFDEKDGDLRFCYVSKEYMNVQYFADNNSEIELLLHDSNEDGEKICTIEAVFGEKSSDLKEKLEEMIKNDEYDIYIASKETFNAIEDKSVFCDLGYAEKYANGLKKLKNKDGQIYAISLKDNSLVERLGITENEDLYIAAAEEKTDLLSGYRKNGRNISGYILESKDKYR